MPSDRIHLKDCQWVAFYRTNTFGKWGPKTFSGILNFLLRDCIPTEKLLTNISCIFFSAKLFECSFYSDTTSIIFQRPQYGVVEADYALAMSLYHGFELLQLHGSRSLYNFLEGILSGDKGHGKTRAELSRNADFCEIMELLKNRYSDTNR